MSNTVYTCSLFFDSSSFTSGCLSVIGLAEKSASSVLLFSRVGVDGVSSPIAFLKPLIEAPRSEPSVRSFGTEQQHHDHCDDQQLRNTNTAHFNYL